ncbi:HAD family hydrolase [Pradoshia sp.]|uniref:HAD family hydrolase n=1 Tax=Pradoshia sp. TaxID=2651281 RepID=UPI003F0643CB
MELKTILFDFDGTIADTLPAAFDAFRYVFKKYDGKEMTDEDIVQYFGPIEDEMLRKHLEHKDKLNQAIEDFYEQYEKGHDREFEGLEKIQEMLEQFKEMDLNLGIVTGKSRRSLTFSLEALGIYDYFDVTIAGDDVKNPKPDKEGVEKCMKLLQNKPSEVLFVGDSESDMAAGAAAGVKTAAAQWFSTVQTSDFKTEPDYTFTSISDFCQYIEGHQQAKKEKKIH